MTDEEQTPEPKPEPKESSEAADLRMVRELI